MPTLLLADDDPGALPDILNSFGYQVTHVRDGAEAYRVIQAQCPQFDMILLDMDMPTVNSWDLLRTIRQHPVCKSIPVMMLSASELDQVSGLKTGADDFVVKPLRVPNLLARLEALLRRSRWQKRTAQEVLTPPPELEERPIQPLTEREKDILGLVAKGLSNREIAEQLVLSELTVKTHLKNMFKKLHVSSRTQAILVGLSHALIKGPSEGGGG
jgi:DNA-binding NarL/FixJ family response regulator